MIKQLREWFELNRPYCFDIGDLTALLYTLCAMGCMGGYDMSPLFLIASTIGVATCWQARRINLVVLNVALWIMNVYNLILIVIGG